MENVRPTWDGSNSNDKINRNSKKIRWHLDTAYRRSVCALPSRNNRGIHESVVGESGPGQKKRGTSRTETEAGSGKIKHRKTPPQRRWSWPVSELRALLGQEIETNDDVAGPSLKNDWLWCSSLTESQKRPRFCSSQKSEIPGVIGGSDSHSSFLLAFFSLYTTEWTPLPGRYTWGCDQNWQVPGQFWVGQLDRQAHSQHLKQEILC